MDPGPRQRLASSRQRRRQAHAVRPGDPGGHDAARSISSDPTSTTWRASSTWRRFAAAGLKLGVDPLGGAAVHYWQPIADTYGLDITVTNPAVDPTFRFMTLDHDGQIRMDCSSPYAMASLVKLKDRFDLAFGNDPDSDRHGIVTKSLGLMNPNHYLAVAIRYLLTHRPDWPAHAKVGKTLVSSSLIDRVVEQPEPVALRGAGRLQVVRARVARRVVLLRRRGECRRQLPAARRHASGRPIRTARSSTCWPRKSSPARARTRASTTSELTAQFGTPFYTRIDAPATPEQKARLQKLDPADVKASDLAGEPITAKLTRAPGNDAPIGGLKVVAASGWFAARPSGTENIYKIYAESFRDQDHLDAIVAEAQQIVTDALN